MASPPPFTSPKVKVRRALKLMTELEADIAHYLDSGPVKVTTTCDTEQGRRTISTHISVQGVSECTSAIIGDVLHNLRAALDLTACDAVRAAKKSDKDVYFPFSKDADSLKEAIQKRHFDRAGDDAVKYLKSIKPHGAGDFLLRAIHDLDIQDKHQAIIPVPLSFAGPILRLYDPDGTPNLSIVGDPNAPSTPIKVVFPDDCALSGKEVVPTLHELVKLVDGIIDGFAAIQYT